MKPTSSKSSASKSRSSKPKITNGNPQAVASNTKHRAASKAPAVTVGSPTPPVETKQSQLIALLRSSSGATLAQMMTLTGWQAHTVRGMISGSLRKRLGLNVQWQLEDAVRVYRIVEGA